MGQNSSARTVTGLMSKRAGARRLEGSDRPGQRGVTGNRRLPFVLLAVVVSSSASLFGQVTTGRLIGTVRDDGGHPIAGATVTIASPAQIGGPQTRTSDQSGTFAFINLAPGAYSVVGELGGYATQEWNQVKVPLGGTAAVDVVLHRPTYTGEINVVEDALVVDPTRVNSGQVFDEQYLQATAIGSRNRSYLRILNQTAGVADGFSGDMAQPRVFGSTVGENAYFVDGMDTTDPMTGTAFASMNFDTVAEIQFQTGGYEAEYGRATGGVLNLVTKSGGNQLSGTFDIRFTDQSLVESGDHFNAGTQDISFLRTALTIGGPVVYDRLWFFASYQRTDDTFTPDETGFTRDSVEKYYLAKLTWQIDPSLRISARYSSDPVGTDNATYSRFTEPEATPHFESSTAIAAAEMTGVLSEALLWGATLGAYVHDGELVPQSGDYRTIGHSNIFTGVDSVNYGGQEYGTGTRYDATTDLTWFVDDLAGSHEFKLGVEYSDSKQTIRSCSTGSPGGERCVEGVNGFFFEDILLDGAPAPLVMWEDEPLYEGDYTGVLTTAYIQDAWQIGGGLSLKIGLRYDSSSFVNNAGNRVGDFDLLQPRLGVAWDLTGDGKTLARASWGRFMHPGVLSLPTYLSSIQRGSAQWLSCSTFVAGFWQYPVESVEDCAALAAGWGIIHRLDHEGWDPYGWILDSTFADTIVVAPDLKPTFADEVILAVEREVGARSSIDLMYVDKTTHDIYDDTCSGNLPTPSPDAVCDEYVVANITAATRDYQGFVLSFETRGLNWLTLLASYTWSKSRGSVEYDQSRGPDFDYFPWHYENRYGYLSDHRRHRFKINGFATIRGDWTVAAGGFWSSPFTWQPVETRRPDNDIPYGTSFVEPRGSREANSSYELDLQLSKGFTIGGWRFVAIGSVYNVFSSENPTFVCDRVTGCGGTALGEATAWQLPRRYEVGFRVEF